MHTLPSPLDTIPTDWVSWLPDWPHHTRWQTLIGACATNSELSYPPLHAVFNSLKLTPFDKVRVVILGQDPYHGPGQADGLAFSVKEGVRVPPSLRNIFSEYSRDLGLPTPTSGCLVPWAKQGVLMLNTVLTVAAAKAGSHRHYGWQAITASWLNALALNGCDLVFLLWGADAQRLGNDLPLKAHHVLTAPHPSPLSAYRGFIGCGHFSKTNEFLQNAGHAPINWCLSDVNV